MLLRAQAGRRTGKGGDIAQLGLRQLFGSFPGLQIPAHGASAEDIPGSGGIHRTDPCRAPDRYTDIPGRRVAALRPQRRVYQAYSVFIQQLPCSLLRIQSPQKTDLLIADLYNVCLLQAPFDGPLRFSTAVCAGSDPG